MGYKDLKQKEWPRLVIKGMLPIENADFITNEIDSLTQVLTPEKVSLTLKEPPARRTKGPRSLGP